MMRCIIGLASTTRSLGRTDSEFDMGLEPLRGHRRLRVRVDEINDRLHWCSRQKHTLDTHLVQPGDVHVRNDAPDDHQYLVLKSLLSEERHHTRADVHVRAREDRQTDDLRILLQRGGDDLLGGLTQPGVNDLHPRIAQRTGNDLGPPIVAVETGLRDDDADPCHQIVGSSTYSPHTRLSVWHISYTHLRAHETPE